MDKVVSDAIVSRSIAGQMPSMAVFSETQQVSAAEKQSELAWREAQRTRVERRDQKRSYRVPIFVLFVFAGVAAVLVLLHGGGTPAPSLSTPANDLPWRSVPLDGGATVAMPGVPAEASTSGEIGQGTRVATAVPGATTSVSVYRADYGMRGAGAVAIDLLGARATELGDAHASSRVKQNRDRWGDAYDLTVIADASVARLRVIVIGADLFFIEVVGSASVRTDQIFSHIVNSLTP